MNVYFEIFSHEFVEVFIPDIGFIEFTGTHAIDSMLSKMIERYGSSLNLIEFTDDLFDGMLDSGEFEGYD